MNKSLTVIIFDWVAFLKYIILFIIVINHSFAQQNDSLRIIQMKDSIHHKKAVKKAIYSTARKATIMSTCLPGLGQIYNKKYNKNRNGATDIFIRFA